MKQIIRSFSLGLLISGLILFTIYYFNGDSSASETDREFELSDMMAALEEEGYRIVTEEEYIQISLSENRENLDTADEIEETESEEELTNDTDENETNENEFSEDNNQDELDEEEVEQATPETVLITIAPGMASSDISQLLERENLIDDAKAFNAYLQEHDYALYVQMGEHELRTGMSFYQIAEALTN